jgi:hypothetical protein
LRELPDSGHITALAISSMMMIGVSVALCVGDLIVDPVGGEKHDLCVVLFLQKCHWLSVSGGRCVLSYHVVCWV